jgi:hypothetical protein
MIVFSVPRMNYAKLNIHFLLDIRLSNEKAFSNESSIFPRRRSHSDRLGLAVGLFPYLLA